MRTQARTKNLVGLFATPASPLSSKYAKCAMEYWTIKPDAAPDHHQFVATIIDSLHGNLLLVARIEWRTGVARPVIEHAGVEVGLELPTGLTGITTGVILHVSYYTCRTEPGALTCPRRTN